MENKILLFDEEVLLSNEIREGFELQGAKLIPAYTYSEAIRLLKENKFDSILVDIVIPFNNEDKKVNPNLHNNMRTGIEFKKHVIQMIEKKEIDYNPRIFYFTAISDLPEGDSSGVTATIHKPKRPKQIFQQVMGS